MNTETIFRKLVINSLIRSLKGNRSFSHFRSRLSPRTGHTSERVVKVPLYISCRGKKDELSSLFVPVPVKISSNCDDINVGEELSTKLEKGNLQKILNKFFKRTEIKQLSAENGLDAKLFHQAFISFRRFCTESEALPTDLHLILSDILQNSGHVDDIFPFFLRHAKQVFPHLECMEDLKHISDLRSPPNWYPEARALNRKIIFHSGPTNSGKTYHALERFKNAKSGVYCGPLKLLAAEVFSKTNDEGIPCDLVTGEERKYANEDQSKANHVCCTVEMTSLTDKYEVAVIDEVQMIKDYGRGWAWTRALLGICAEEIHICGEGAAIDLVQELLYNTGEELEVNQYNRLTKLHKENKALEKLDNVQPGDCIVCFNKNDIYSVSRYLENINKECAVIYGGLPPGTKLAQSKKFNDPNDSCKILVATDAIGMGLNLSIKRVIFYSLIKPVMNEKGEREMDYVTTSQALQIAGRAGRYGTQFEEGYVTTMKEDDLKILNEIMSRPVEEITAAGIHPTAEQIELFAYHLPQATLSNLIDIFVTICQVDTTSYFMCNVDDFKFLADMIQHVPLALKTRYIFCCAPINRKMPFVCTLFLKFARQFSCNEPLTLNWLCNNIGWPFSPPETLIDLVHLEAVFDVLDLYLWLSYRFLDLFPDVELVRDMQKELDSIIQMGVKNITQLLKISQLNVVDDAFASKNKKERYKRKLGVDNSKEKMQNDERIEIKLSKSKLSEQLVSQGLLTPRMLSTLQKEWTDKKLSSKPGRPKKKR